MNVQSDRNPSCIKPLVSVVQLLGRQWTIPLILTLGEEKKNIRYSEIREKLIIDTNDMISDSTLSRKLSELTKLGIVARRSFDEIPPRVEYSLTNAGITLFHTLHQIAEWTREQCHSGTLRIPGSSML
jgi:DNA-binding HxlR family transcriptional regulator